MPAVLALDLGKSASRAALWTEAGEQLGMATGPGIRGLATPTGPADAEAAIGRLWQELRERVETSNVLLGLGVAGAIAAGPAAGELAERLLGLDAVTATAVCSDAVIGQLGALAGQPGVVLVAGTGAVAFGIDRSGQFCQADGWGAVLGDCGSGSWIGLAGLRAALADLDGRGPATGLRRAAAELIDTDDLAGLPVLLAGHPNPARYAAGFAPEVARLAAAGDLVADLILAEAARQLAGSVLAAVSRQLASDPSAAPVAVALTGGLLELGAVLLDPLHQALADSTLPITVRQAVAGPLAGARMLAARQDTIAESLVHRAGGRPAPVGRAGSRTAGGDHGIDTGNRDTGDRAADTSS